MNILSSNFLIPIPSTKQISDSLELKFSAYSSVKYEKKGREIDKKVARGTSRPCEMSRQYAG